MICGNADQGPFSCASVTKLQFERFAPLCLTWFRVVTSACGAGVGQPVTLVSLGYRPPLRVASILAFAATAVPSRHLA